MNSPTERTCWAWRQVDELVWESGYDSRAEAIDAACTDLDVKEAFETARFDQPHGKPHDAELHLVNGRGHQ